MENTRTLSDPPVSAPRFAGRAVNRIKDPMLLAGRAEFVSGDRRRDRSIDEVVHHLDLVLPELRELDLNPVKVLAPGQGAIVVDGRMRVGRLA